MDGALGQSFLGEGRETLRIEVPLDGSVGATSRLEGLGKEPPIYS